MNLFGRSGTTRKIFQAGNRFITLLCLTYGPPCTLVYRYNRYKNKKLSEDDNAVAIRKIIVTGVLQAF